MKARRKRVTLPNVDVSIGTTPGEIRDTLYAIVAAAENNAVTEESGSPQQRDQLAIAEVLTIAGWEIMSRSRQHWKGNSADPRTTTVARSAAPEPSSSEFNNVRVAIIGHQLKIHSLHDAGVVSVWAMALCPHRIRHHSGDRTTVFAPPRIPLGAETGLHPEAELSG
jgi:hypothetical protein